MTSASPEALAPERVVVYLYFIIMAPEVITSSPSLLTLKGAVAAAAIGADP
ncbi:hypothetical protein D3C78_739310 [compost metagenome]